MAVAAYADKRPKLGKKSSAPQSLADELDESEASGLLRRLVHNLKARSDVAVLFPMSPTSVP